MPVIASWSWGRFVARAAAAASKIEDDNAWVVTLRDGLVVHAQMYYDHALVLDAAGLSE